MISDPAYTALKPIVRLALRELRDLAAQRLPAGLPDSPGALARHLRIPKAAIAAVLDTWFPLDLKTGMRFDPTLKEDQERMAKLSEQKAAAGRASAIARGYSPKIVGKISKRSHTRVEQPFKSDSTTTTTYPTSARESRERVFNRTDVPTYGRTKEEAAPVGGGSVEASPPTGGPTEEWHKLKAQLLEGRRSRGSPRASNGSGSLDSGQT